MYSSRGMLILIKDVWTIAPAVMSMTLSETRRRRPTCFRLSVESNRPLVKVSNTDRVDGTGPISKSLLESKSRTHGRFTTSKNPSVLFSIWMFDSLSGLLFAVFILLQLMVNNSFSIVFCPEAVLRIRCQHVNVLLPLGSHGRIRQDVPQAVKGIAAVRNVGGMNYAHFVSALPGGATPQVLLSLR